MIYTGSLVIPAGAGSGPELSGFPGADIHDFQEAVGELGACYLEG